MTTAKIMTKATETVTPEAMPLTLLGHNSPNKSQGMVPTPAPNTKHRDRLKLGYERVDWKL